MSRKALVRDSRGNTKVAPFSLATSKRTRERQQHAAAADAKRRDRMQFIRKAKMQANQAARAAQLSAHRAQQRADMDMLMPNTFGNALVAPLMYVDVNITPEVSCVWQSALAVGMRAVRVDASHRRARVEPVTSQHTERIAVWEGEDVRTVARRFSIQHGLSGRTAGELLARTPSTAVSCASCSADLRGAWWRRDRQTDWLTCCPRRRLLCWRRVRVRQGQRRWLPVVHSRLSGRAASRGWLQLLPVVRAQVMMDR